MFTDIKEGDIVIVHTWNSSIVTEHHYYYFSHIRKSLYWITPNRQGEKQFISFGF